MKADLFIGPGAARILNPEVIGDCGTIHRENDLYGVSLLQIKLSQEKAGVGPAGIQAAVPEPGMQGGVFRIQEMKGQAPESGIFLLLGSGPQEYCRPSGIPAVPRVCAFPCFTFLFLC